MSSTDITLGLPERRPSSRVLKPPGGGHSNIFAEPEVIANPPRPKYDQQNSSNLNCVMNTMDPNETIKKNREEIEKMQQSNINIEEKLSPINSEKSNGNDNKITGGTSAEQENISGGRVRVPPGGFSSGLW